jgi:hypothetical protein
MGRARRAHVSAGIRTRHHGCMEEVAVEPVALDRLAAILPPERAARLDVARGDERDELGEDPYDLDEFAAILRLLADHDLWARLGPAAHARVLGEFLGDRHLDQYVDLFSDLVAASG